MDVVRTQILVTKNDDVFREYGNYGKFYFLFAPSRKRVLCSNSVSFLEYLKFRWDIRFKFNEPSFGFEDSISSWLSHDVGVAGIKVSSPLYSPKKDINPGKLRIMINAGSGIKVSSPVYSPKQDINPTKVGIMINAGSNSFAIQKFHSSFVSSEPGEPSVTND
ncbi:hypothetical protein V6N13_142607 [Hibiscus sabdariffa]|uniref:Uncharacterized protein n=1 Tax=Hibiscus sabdariffa TaxID=183260 RepID=A0ABR2FEW2_9ROSI